MKRDTFKCIFLTLFIFLLIPFFMHNHGWFCVIGAPLISLDIFFMMKLAKRKKILQSTVVKKSFSYRLISWVSYTAYICFLILFYGFIIFISISSDENESENIRWILFFITVFIPPYLSLFFCTDDTIEIVRIFSNLVICGFIFCEMYFSPCHSDICFNGIVGGILGLISISVPLFVHNLLISLGKSLIKNSDNK